jgi:hypothetical protein
MYFLIDTNIFVDFIKDGKEEYLLDQIIQLSEEKTIDILLPEVLMNEWNKKKKQTLDSISKTFSDASSYSSNEIAESVLQEAFVWASHRAAKVDELLSKAIFFKVTGKVKIETINRSTQGKAPFHDGKSKSINDALIYFSTLAYLRRKKVFEFVFVSKNVSDFSDQQKRTQLHEELIDPQIVVTYFTSLSKCFYELKHILSIEQKAKEEKTYRIQLVKKKSLNLLEYIYEVVSAYKTKLEFLPTHLLARLEPFRIHNLKHDYAYHSGVTLYTNNQALLDFFKGVDFEKLRFKKGAGFQNSKANLQKLDFVITGLNHNLVFELSHVTHREKLSIRRIHEPACDCAACCWYGLRLDYLINHIASEPSPIKKGFVYFQLGRFTDAFHAYHDLFVQAQKDNNKVLVYRLSLILYWVAQHGEHRESEEQAKEFMATVKAFDREGAFFQTLNGNMLDRELGLFFHGSTMMDHFKLSVKECAEKIRLHYTSQLGASYSSNSNFNNLIHAFLNFELFTIYNGMAYTRYSDFNSICEDFSEGIFLCRALNKYQSSRIIFFNDFILERLLLYGDADKMIIYYNRYVKKGIPYDKKGTDFKKKALNLLQLNEATIQYLADPDFWEGNYHFYRLFWNLVLLLAIVDFDKAFIVSCVKSLMPHLKRLPKRETHKLKHLASLIHSKGKLMGNTLLQELFFLTIDKPELHNHEVFSSFSAHGEDAFKPIKTKKQFENVVNLFFFKCEKCGEYHQDAIYHLYPLLSEKFQLNLKDRINSRLSEKFDHELYYKAVIMSIIDYREYFSAYLECFKPPASKQITQRAYMEGELHLRGINELMNLVFKTHARLPKSFKAAFSGITDYYDWLLNMSNFDYSKFDPLWIIQYATTFYLQEIFAIKPVRDAVRDYLKQNNQPTLAGYYAQFVD